MLSPQRRQRAREWPGISLDDLLRSFQLDGGSVVVPVGVDRLKLARARFEREYIAAISEQHHGRMTEAAKTLRIQRRKP